MVHVCDAVYRMHRLCQHFAQGQLTDETRSTCNTWLAALCGFHSEGNLAFVTSKKQSDFSTGVESLLETVRFSSDENRLEHVRLERAHWGFPGDAKKVLDKAQILWIGRCTVSVGECAFDSLS